MREIILASQSPRRQQLLTWAEIPFKVMVSHTDEWIPEQVSIAEAPEYLAREKAETVLSRLSSEQIHMPVLAADTIVVLNNSIIGKPQNEEEAIFFLQQLSGKMHEVITGVCILSPKKNISFSETTRVVFHDLTLQQIEYYVKQYKPFDKAGGYAIQEWIGVVGIKKVEGDFYNVMGLPVSRVVQALQWL